VTFFSSDQTTHQRTCLQKRSRPNSIYKVLTYAVRCKVASTWLHHAVIMCLRFECYSSLQRTRLLPKYITINRNAVRCHLSCSPAKILANWFIMMTILWMTWGRVTAFDAVAYFRGRRITRQLTARQNKGVSCVRGGNGLASVADSQMTLSNSSSRGKATTTAAAATASTAQQQYFQQKQQQAQRQQQQQASCGGCISPSSR